jgi:hypothetical protein
MSAYRAIEQRIAECGDQYEYAQGLKFALSAVLENMGILEMLDLIQQELPKDTVQISLITTMRSGEHRILLEFDRSELSQSQCTDYIHRVNELVKYRWLVTFQEWV